MKKTIKTLLLLCLSLILCMAFLTSCNENNSTDGTTGSNQSSEQEGNIIHTHSFGEWVVTKEATCLADGAQERTCACGEKEKQTLGAKGHTPGEWMTVKEPTAKEDGLKEQKCTVCGEKTATETLPATGSLGLAYTVNADGKTCTITGIGTCTDAEVVIPASLNGYQVTAIAKRAFYDCKTMKEITIPATVKEIGTQIFFKADNLTTVYYNSTYYSSENPFMNIPSVKKIVFGGTKVPGSICNGMNALESVLIGNSVTSIGNYAFSRCSSLTSVEIPDSVTSIGRGWFFGCSSLTSVEIPDSVTSIGGEAFAFCKSLENLMIPQGVTSIGYEAFENCSSLTSVEIPDSVTSIGRRAFVGCSSLTSVEIPDSVTSIGDYAFSSSSLTRVEIPDSVTSIGMGWFYGCSSLTSVEIPDSVTSIGDEAFSGCSSLTSVEIPDSVTSIGWSAFSGCSSLTSVEIPDSVMSIGSNAFYACSSLTSVRYAGTKAEWEAIEKGSSLFDWSCVMEIVCSDGTISLG